MQINGKFKKVLLDTPDEDIYDKNNNKLNNHYKKSTLDIPGIDALDKNGNK